MIPANEEKRLATELAFYVEHKTQWLQRNTGKYVVVQDSNLLGFYDSFETAFRAGVAEFGVQKDFLVKQVLAHEPVYFIF